jgi:predicted peroxiredoxin
MKIQNIKKMAARFFLAHLIQVLKFKIKLISIMNNNRLLKKKKLRDRENFIKPKSLKMKRRN